MTEAEKALLIMRLAHDGQTDKLGAPYEQHPLAVAELLGPDATDQERAVALLHDVLEGGKFTPGELIRLGISDSTCEAVEYLSRLPRETYAEYIGSIIRSGNSTALKVKRADLLHNLSRIDKLPDADSLKARYEKSLARIEAAIEELTR